MSMSIYEREQEKESCEEFKKESKQVEVTKWSYKTPILVIVCCLVVFGILFLIHAQQVKIKKEMIHLSETYVEEKRDKLQQELKDAGFAEVKVKYELGYNYWDGDRDSYWRNVPSMAYDDYIIYFESEWIDVLYTSGQQSKDYSQLRTYMMDIGRIARYIEDSESWDVDERHSIDVTVKIAESDWDIGAGCDYFRIYGKSGKKFSMDYGDNLRGSSVYLDDLQLCESEVFEEQQAKIEKEREEAKKNGSSATADSSSQSTWQSGTLGGSRSGSSTTKRKSASRSYSRSKKGDYYDSDDYDDADSFAEEWAEEFGDGDYDDGYDDAYDYWEDYYDD